MKFHPTMLREISAWTAARLHQHRHTTPLFLLRETLAAFRLHNGFNTSAALSFYAMFALIPMALLMFFLLSHLVVSSSHATAKLTMLTSNLVPKFSHRIMIEVYNISRHKAVWGVFGIFALFWAVTPLAGALRSALHSIFGAAEMRSFLRRQVKDALAVLSILLLFFLFSLSGVMLEKALAVLRPPQMFSGSGGTLASLLLSTLLIAIFYQVVLPIRAAFRHVLAGALLTATLWFAMRPAFGLFLFAYQSYGTIFGGMKNMFISIGWLYYSFAVFLLGTELISTLHKHDVLLLKGLFAGNTNSDEYHDRLMRRFGQQLERGQYVFREGNQAETMHFILTGAVGIYHQGRMLREVNAGEYFGEMAVLAGAKRTADAIVQSGHAKILRISADNITALMREEPGIAMSLLREMARRFRQASGLAASAQ